MVVYEGRNISTRNGYSSCLKQWRGPPGGPIRDGHLFGAGASDKKPLRDQPYGGRLGCGYRQGSAEDS